VLILFVTVSVRRKRTTNTPVHEGELSERKLTHQQRLVVVGTVNRKIQHKKRFGFKHFKKGLFWLYKTKMQEKNFFSTQNCKLIQIFN
jgi:hypothetical protein